MSSTRTCLGLFEGAPLVLVITLAACGGGGEEPARNLLLITVDTLRVDHLGAYGYERATSPNLDRLARESVVMDAAYASSSWTLPALCTIMTSEHASTHGCSANDSSLSDRFPTLAEQLDRVGFRTCAIASHVFLDRKYGLSQGFDDYDDALIARTLADSHVAVTSPSVTEKGIAWLEARAERPRERWFLWLHYFDPHELYQAHPGVSSAFGLEHDLDRYDGEVAFTDDCLGRVLARLDELGQREETVLVLVADHGEEFGDHGGTGHRSTLYEEVLRVPWILRAPGLEPSRMRSTVSTIDLMPTVLELLDLAPPETIAGRSLLPSLRGEPQPTRPALGELTKGARAWDTLVDGRWKLHRDRATGGLQLFDLESDPWEQLDVASEHARVVSALEQEIQRITELAHLKAKLFGPPGEVELSAEEQLRLKQLGYGGGDF